VEVAGSANMELVSSSTIVLVAGDWLMISCSGTVCSRTDSSGTVYSV